ncbi:MAG: Xaa-Pro peptidase family protein [bacterium]
MDNFLKRQKRLLKKMSDSRLPSALIINKVNLRYLTGFHCSYGYLLIFSDKTYLLTDSRYSSDARSGAAVDEVVEVRAGDAPKRIAELLFKHGVRRIAFEPASITVAEFDTLKKPLKNISLAPQNNFVEDIRAIKDESEIALVKRSSQVMDRAFKKLLGFIRAGVTEADIRARLESDMILQGIDGISFDTIVASGPRGAFAHGKPSARKVRLGDFIVIDFGACTDGYHSDMTRTVYIGSPSAADRLRYRAVQEAQRSALAAAVAGVESSAPDRAARNILSKYELDRYFTHGLGHGVGMDVHEQPRLFFAGKEKLVPGMIFTIEPGIYIDGWGGIRIEDTVVLTKSGPVQLTKSAKSLICL